MRKCWLLCKLLHVWTLLWEDYMIHLPLGRSCRGKKKKKTSKPPGFSWASSKTTFCSVRPHLFPSFVVNSVQRCGWVEMRPGGLKMPVNVPGQLLSRSGCGGLAGLGREQRVVPSPALRHSWNALQSRGGSQWNVYIHICAYICMYKYIQTHKKRLHCLSVDVTFGEFDWKGPLPREELHAWVWSLLMRSSIIWKGTTFVNWGQLLVINQVLLQIE